MSRHYGKGQPLRRRGAYQLICEEALKDGIITGVEGQILHQFAQAMRLSAESVTQIVSDTERYLRNGSAMPGGHLEPRTAYQRVLRYCMSDGFLDEDEQEILKQLRQILCISIDFHQRLLADLSNGIRTSELVAQMGPTATREPGAADMPNPAVAARAVEAALGAVVPSVLAHRWAEALEVTRKMSGVPLNGSETDALRARAEGLSLLLAGAALAEPKPPESAAILTAIDDMVKICQENQTDRGVVSSFARTIGPAGIVTARARELDRGRLLVDLAQTVLAGPLGDEQGVCLEFAEGAVVFRAALRSAGEAGGPPTGSPRVELDGHQVEALARVLRQCCRRFAASPAIAAAKQRFETIENQPLDLSLD